MNTIASVSTGLAIAVLSGCASVNPRAGLPDVEKGVSQRTGYQVYWNTGGGEDRAVLGKLREVLLKPLDPDAAVQIALLNNHAGCSPS